MTCPLCHQATTWEGNSWRPFCSERCQMTDLGAWAAEQYRVPGPTLMVDTSLPGTLDGHDDREPEQDH